MTCSICGKKGQHETRCATVAAWTTYSTSNNLKHYIHTDSMTVWEMSICTSCMPRARLNYLNDRIRSASIKVLWGIILFIIGMAGFAWFDSSSGAKAQSGDFVDFLEMSFHGGMAMLSDLSITFILILGAGMAVYGTVKAITCWMSRARMTEHDVVPEEWINKCFEGDFKRKLKMREQDVLKHTKKNGNVAPAPSLPAKDYPLPAFKKVEQLSEEERKIAVAHGGVASDRKWRVIRVYDTTREGFFADPPAEWRELTP